MLAPRSLLAHADGLLGATSPSDADIRRAISALYYAVFHLVTVAAARRLAGGQGALLQSRVRRSTEHNSVRKLCIALSTAGGSTPKVLEGVLNGAPSAALIRVASAFARLQDARHAADYDLDVAPTLKEAEGWRELAHEAFEDWGDIEADPDTQVFLTAVILAERWSRRG